MLGNNISNANNAVIGGYDDSDDHWRTTTQSANDGEQAKKASQSRKKCLSVTNPDDMISPITGDRVADYGTWAEDMKRRQQQQGEGSDSEDDDNDELEADPLFAKLKAQFAARGATGINGLARVFKIMDDDGSNTLSFGEFKKAMKEFKLALSEMELVVLFKRFGELLSWLLFGCC
jgi:hypothetical protein